MSQHKDSESGADLEKPTTPSVPENTPEEPTVVLDQPAGPEQSDSRRLITMGAAGLLVVSVIAAAVFGFLWFGDHKDETRAEARDAALTDARQAAVNLMSINPDDIDGSLANIRSSMTGDLLKQQEDGQDQLKQTAQDSKTRIKADVEGITLTSLNSERDHASAFAVLKITRSWPGGQPATFRQLWTLDLVKVGSTWKAEKAQNLGEPVPLGTSAPQQTSTPQTPAPGN
ncbi:hypothetical protein [Nocardia concava]|uniref:hypothetical protein n=1 Tax=Nocardia concava TaxID=257281 RepID=UPI0002E57D1C|nr:hypothetical protein [Nocardia concava]